MKKALNLAKMGIGFVSPNPPVGAVLVKDNKIIAKGYHKKYGGPHAEVYALKNFNREELKDTILFVTLEPCAHCGKTPPCANLIIEKGVKKVVIGVRDKNPLVSGNGIDLLKKNGIEVVEGVLTEELNEFYAPFFKYIVEGIPFVTLKFAQTLDGKNSPELGNKYLVSDKTLRYVHKLRFESDAIMVGINTVLSDNPSLDIRYYSKKKDLLKVVLDTHGRITGKENIFKSKGSVLVYTSNTDLMKKNIPADIVVVEQEGKWLNLKEVLKDLGSKKIQNLLVEGGGKLSYELLQKKHVDRLILIITPYILGGAKNLSVEGKGFKSLKNAFFLSKYKLRKIENDLILIWQKSYN